MPSRTGLQSQRIRPALLRREISWAVTPKMLNKTRQIEREPASLGGSTGSMLRELDTPVLGRTVHPDPTRIKVEPENKQTEEHEPLMLSNKTIVVTGAASGIGAATAKTLKANGATVIGVDRNQPTDSVARYVAVDLADPASIDRCISEIGGGINALCSIAGVPPTQGGTAVLKVNFLGLKHLTLGMIPHLADGASIVNMSSLAGIGWPKAIETIKVFLAEGRFDTVEEFCEENNINAVRAYFFAKELLNVWTMQNRWTWRDRGIRINSISPGPVDTPILRDFMESLGERAEEDVEIMDRLGIPEDIAPVVAFLCSDASQWIRGTNIPCDGGLSARHIARASGLE